jgi:hypothetical protein
LARDTNGTIATLEKDAGIKHPPTGINGLSPQSPVLRGLDTLNIGAPYHSVIGDRGRGDTPNSSDGVVAYWSSHLAGAQSELIVPGSHGSFALPQTVSELKRILRFHLSVASAPHRKTTPRGQHLAAGPNSGHSDPPTRRTLASMANGRGRNSKNWVRTSR